MIPIKMTRYSIKIVYRENGISPYLNWMWNLDRAVCARISARVARFENGHFGDHRFVGSGISEARFFFGSGYRIYFSVLESSTVLLLTGGDKSTQVEDIENAKRLLKDYLEELSAHQK